MSPCPPNRVHTSSRLFHKVCQCLTTQHVRTSSLPVFPSAIILPSNLLTLENVSHPLRNSFWLSSVQNDLELGCETGSSSPWFSLSVCGDSSLHPHPISSQSLTISCGEVKFLKPNLGMDKKSLPEWWSCSWPFGLVQRKQKTYKDPRCMNHVRCYKRQKTDEAP